PALRAVQGSFRLREQIEDARQEFGGNADTLVPHPQYRLVSVLLEAQKDVTLILAVFGGVVEKIYDDLFQPSSIGVHPDGLRRKPHGEYVLVPTEQGAATLHGTFHHPPHVQVFLVKVNPSGGNA